MTEQALANVHPNLMISMIGTNDLNGSLELRMQRSGSASWSTTASLAQRIRSWLWQRSFRSRRWCRANCRRNCGAP